ncbi:MAG: hypothetical protein ACK5X3_04540 [Pseudomonadota bacterium]
MKQLFKSVERYHGIAMHNPETGKYWHFATRPGFSLPLVDHENGVDPFERFQGVMARRSPAPCMMQALNNIFSSAAKCEVDSGLPEPSRTRLHVLLGDPGVGKTELAHVLGHAMGWNVFSIPPGSGGGNLDELIQETQFGSTSATSVIEKINTKLLNASADQELVKLLERRKLLSKTTQANGQEIVQLNIEAIDQKGGIATLREIASVALPQAVQNDAPITYRPGRLLKKLIEAKQTGMPTVILVDEINRYKNFGSRMQNLYEVLAGTRDKCSLVSTDDQGNPKDYEFTRSDLEHVILLGTGNIPDAKKEPEARQLSDSLESRIGVKPVEMRFTAADYAHRLCQEHLGFALTTYFEADRDRYASDPAAAADHFSGLLMKGRTPAEQKQHSHIGTQQLLQQAGSFKEGAELLGNVYFELQELCAGRTTNLNPELKKAKRELPPFGPRQVQNPLAQWALNLPDDPDFIVDEPPSQFNLGSRMTNALLYWIDTNFPANRGLDQTRQHIAAILVENRVLSADEAAKRFGADRQAELPRAEPTGKQVAELMNVNPAIGRDAELEAAQALLFEIAQAKGYALEGVLPDQLFNKQAVAGMLDEYERLAQMERQKTDQPDGQIVMPDLVKEATGKFTLKLLQGGVRPAEGDYTKKTSPPAHMLEQQLLFMMTKHGGDLSEFFIKKPPADSIQVGDEAALPSDSSKTIASLKQGEAAQLKEAQSIEDEGRKQEAIARIQEDFEKRIEDVTTKDYQKNYALVAGDHASGIGVATIILSVPQDKKSPNKGFTLLRDKDPADETSLPRYVLIGDVDIGEKVKDYLREIHVEYVNTAAKDGPQQLNDTLRSFIGVGALRLLEKTKPDGTPLSDTEKVEAITDYETTWRTALADKFSLHGVEGQGRLLTAEAMDQLRETMRTLNDPEARYEAAMNAGVGVGEAAHSMHPDKPQHERILDRLVATTSFNITHGHFHPQAAAQITPPPQAMTR